MKEKVFEVIVRIEKTGNKMIPVEVVSGTSITDKIPYGARRYALEGKYMLGKSVSAAEKIFWRRVDEIPENYKSGETSNNDTTIGYRKLTDDEVRTLVANSYAKKPRTLILDELNWKLATRAIARGENIMFLGASGGGKTLTARTLAKVYGRPFFKFNLGAMQDARTSLIGNTHYSPEKGTFFAQSDFVTAIQTPGACILLDEMTRMSNDAENILLTPLDADQRYLRIDENPDSPVVEVAEGVCFFATANVGTEYTSTRILDRATKDRFTTMVNIPLLTENEEYGLLKILYPKVNKELLKGVAKVATYTRDNIKSEEPDLSTIISTRSTVEQIALLIDGFKFSEVMNAIVLPMYEAEGGVESERSHMLQLVQGYSNLDNVAVYPSLEPEISDPDPNKVPENIFDENKDSFEQ